jgi:quercetin dioxygenase-like cupin family protein
MDLIRREQIPVRPLQGRDIQTAVGKDGLVASAAMTMGWAHFSFELGAVEPHQHAEELVYVLRVRGCRVRFGPARDRLDGSLELEEGMLLHIPAGEYHSFVCDPGGSMEVLFFYGGVDNIRPEEKGDG